MIINSSGYKFRRGTGSPFDAMPNKDYDFGSTRGVPCQWCRKCHMSVDTVIQKYNQNQVWGFKQHCKRCGAVTQSAVYYHIATSELVRNGETGLFEKAKRWSIEPEKLTK